ncbi:10339_t:CDS:2 [Paraglomus occultum]|uniref:10339_t:CDS:1 n=1 Tax=Paraglomus occultum TaxID=144539 RepID=A0A9N9ACR4_9GLOM|nr:10339_t:CDS:2 [Paraglomus occultum]
MKTLREQRSSTFLSLLPLITFVILLTLPYVYAQSYDNKFTYTESIEGLTVADATAEIDGTTLVRLQKAANDSQCPFTKDIYFRVIFPNNTVIGSTPTINMSSYNYCANLTSTSRISMISLIEGWIYVTYLEDVGLAQFQQYGVPIAYNGTLGETKLLLNYDDGIPGDLYRSMIPEAGFLFAKIRRDGPVIWRRYSTVTEDGKIYALGDGNFTANLRDGSQVYGSNIFRTVDGGYGCAFVTRNYDAKNKNAETNLQWGLQVTFLHPDTNTVSKPSIIWTSPAGVSDVQLGFNACNIAYDGSGYVCILLVTMGQAQMLHQVNFYSTGASYDNFALTFDPKNVVEADRISPLFYGGYMIVNFVDSDIGRVAKNAIVLSPNGTVTKTVTFVSQTYVVNVYARNNTVWHWMNDSPQSWSIISYYLPKFTTYGIDYQNPNVVTTSPTIGQEIPSRQTSISITYDMQVKPNTGNVSIYATDGVNKFLRQTYSPVYFQYWSLDEKNQTVTLQVLNSTFNQPNMTYYVVIENGFVTSKDTGESILGVDGRWRFHTSSVQPQDIFSPAATAIISLTSSGSSHFLGLSSADRSNFLSSLSNSLASIVPASPGRLSISKKFQIDSKTGQDRVLLSLNVFTATSDSEMGVDSILKDLGVLIKNKAITAASHVPETVLVDENYGVQVEPNLWEEYKLNVLIAAAAIFVIGLLYLLASRINPEAQNSAIFTLTLVLYDFAVDVAFIVSNGKDVRSLYVPSILILVATIVYSISMALYIMISENTRSYKFHVWTQSYSQVAAIFTVIAAADIEVLTVLGSKVCKSPFFSAPFSERAHHAIFWASTGSFFIEDVPQFIVQVIYQNNTITYNIIPLLSLVSASVMLVINFITRFYYGITLVRAHKTNSHLESADESASVSDEMDTKEITDETHLSSR